VIGSLDGDGIFGFIGSGKTTLAKQLEENSQRFGSRRTIG
jgi:G3E family GTPase